VTEFPLGPGSTDPLVAHFKRRAHLPVDETFTPDLLPHVRGMQFRIGLEPTGLIDEELVSHLGPAPL
jgi:hypothetical protein